MLHSSNMRVGTNAVRHRSSHPAPFRPAYHGQCRQSSSLHAYTVQAVEDPAQQAHKSTTLLPLDDKYEDRHAFASFANWIVPGTVLLGRYPHVEPSRCTTRDEGEKQLGQILESGITTFVSLQEELPPQDQMTLAGKNGFLPYKATAQLIRSALNGPPPMEVVDGLRNPRLDKFLPTRKRPSATPYKPVELNFVHNPIVDLGIPSQEQLRSLIADLEARIARGEKLYVHCWGGRGRAGTVGACLLASMYGLSADEVLARVQRAFDTRQDDNRRSPETDEQHAFVREFVAGLQR